MSTPPPLPEPQDTAAAAHTSGVHNHYTGQGVVVVQAGSIQGDATINVAPDPLAAHPVPLIATVTLTGAGRHERSDLPNGVYTPWDISVLVEGRSAQAVILHGMRVLVATRRRVSFLPDRGHSGVYPAPLRSRDFNLNLNAEEPSSYARNGQPDFPFTVHASDPELFKITPGVYEHEVDWRFALDWSCAGRHGTITLPENGILRYGPERAYTIPD
ncbi:hypothetical protein [Streptomyces litchfieldiae]|uniref:Uncharacterized protein n=1 Tax=Streptomyces litchfieldiae TaxID=3075543 RepID=A0ABU2N1H0_9ACTN|nr:hypothetical protein [Streptomyces sp. DSM 44938]MDT0347751.1 hypothetical protein [Streptomyces sp. DSM 44938]